MAINPKRKRLGTLETKDAREERAGGISRVGVKGASPQTTAWGRSRLDSQERLLKKMKMIVGYLIDVSLIIF